MFCLSKTLLMGHNVELKIFKMWNIQDLVCQAQSYSLFTLKIDTRLNIVLVIKNIIFFFRSNLIKKFLNLLNIFAKDISSTSN